VTAAHPERVPAPPLQRDGERGVLGGVCAGIARRLGIEPLPIRIVALVLALAGGIGVPLYLLAWAAMPGDSSARGLGRSRRSAVEVALGVGLLAISAMLALRGMGL
jgi:phage shock protein C